MKYKNRVFNYEQIIDEKTFTIPNYQRGFAWKKNKKQNFIKTLISGEPFGTILVYEDNNKLYLIDGLQRINTIREFSDNKYTYLTYDIVEPADSKLFVKCVKKAYRLYGKKIDAIKANLNDEKKVRKTIIDKIIKNDGDIEKAFKALKKFYDMSSFQDRECKDIKGVIKGILKKIEKLCNIKSIKIFALEYTGEAQKLPDIFYNLNTGGATLSKYDVLPSLWNDIKYIIKDDEIIDTVYERYDSIKRSSQFNITINKQQLKSGGITLFEYCYAIGKILYKQEYGFTSFIGKSSDSIEPLSFSILALLIGLKENQTSEIGKVLKNVKPKFLVDIKKLIIEGFNILKIALYDYVKSEKVNDTITESFNYVPSNYMIYHMFISYIRKNYTIDIKNSEIIKNRQSGLDNWNKNFIQYLHLHYFYDFIRNSWSENRQVSDLMKAINDENELYKYSYIITDSEWKDAFEILKDEQLSSNSKGFNLKTKLFLDYLIEFKAKHNPALRDYFIVPKTRDHFSIDYEHIIPLTRFDERGIDNVPKYSLGNACFLTSKVNKSKHGLTLYEQAEEIPGYVLDTTFLDFISYPKENEISFVDDNKEKFEVEYRNFISNRIDNLIDEFIEYKI